MDRSHVCHIHLQMNRRGFLSKASLVALAAAVSGASLASTELTSPVAGNSHGQLNFDKGFNYIEFEVPFNTVEWEFAVNKKEWKKENYIKKI